MTLRRRIQILGVAIVLSTVLLASDVAKPTPTTTFTFEGCWTMYQTGPCKDVFRDDQGNYWICKDCGTTGNPTPGKCFMTSPDRKSTRLNSSHIPLSRMPSSA